MNKILILKSLPVDRLLRALLTRAPHQKPALPGTVGSSRLLHEYPNPDPEHGLIRAMAIPWATITIIPMMIVTAPMPEVQCTMTIKTVWAPTLKQFKTE